MSGTKYERSMWPHNCFQVEPHFRGIHKVNFHCYLLHSNDYVSRKEGISVTEDHTLLGDPKFTSLTQNEIELFAQVGIIGYEDRYSSVLSIAGE